jgi:hypothetical protein
MEFRCQELEIQCDTLRQEAESTKEVWFVI